MRFLTPLFVVLAALLAIIGWDALGGYALIRLFPALYRSELGLYLAIKGGFALLLALFFTLTGSWRRFGFTGGIAWRYWPALLPIWLAAAVSAVQGIDVPEPLRLAGWFAVSLAVGFGEEGIFRGVILEAIRDAGTSAGRERRAIVLSALLFGLAHLGAITAADPHIVIGQAAFATGIGLALAWVRLAGGSIWPALIAHTVLDFFGIATSDGIAEAMRYSPSGFAYILGMAGFTLIWGGVLASRPVRGA
jgi:membrane protease YdiL (CAAX protease family)